MVDPKMRVEWGCAAPYDATDDKLYAYTGGDPARMAALGVLDDLCDRRGIRHALESLDAQVRGEITESLTEIVRAAVGMSADAQAATFPVVAAAETKPWAEPTPEEIAAWKDAEQKREIEHDARFIAGLAADMLPFSVNGQAIYPGTPEADREQVRRATALLAESRRQVAAEWGSV